MMLATNVQKNCSIIKRVICALEKNMENIIGILSVEGKTMHIRSEQAYTVYFKLNIFIYFIIM